MEAYIPVYEYAQRTGLKTDTVYHRAERGSIESFKNEEGRWFIYYCDEDIPKAPEGYITIDDFAEMHHVASATIRDRIRRGKMNSSDIQIVRSRNKGSTKCRKYVFIRENAPYFPYCGNNAKNKRPGDDWITVHEFKQREGVSKVCVYRWIKDGLIAYANFGRYIFIPKTESKEAVKERIKERRKERKEWLQKTKQVV